MTNIRKEGFHKDRGISPLKLRTISPYGHIPMGIQHNVISGNSDISHGRPHRWHTHTDFAELVLVIQGDVDNVFPDGRRLLLRMGDVMLLMPGSTHYYTAAREMRCYNILFSPELLDLIPGFLSSNANYQSIRKHVGELPSILHLEGRELSAAVDILEQMMQENIKRLPSYEEAMLVGLYRLLIHVSRKAILVGNDAGCKSYNSNLIHTLHFMEANSEKKLTLEQLSKEALMSKSSFRFLFRKLTGLSPIEYLIRLRLQKAVLLLMNSDYRISYIAERCGFSDSNYFARKFRDIFHVSPLAFKKKCAGGELDFNEQLSKLNLD